MKPTSIVSLIIAVLLVILGLVTCIIAQNMANANGEFLFSEDREDGLVNTVDLTDSEISKIELIVSNATINIIGKSDKSCIEFVNFRDNYYNLSVANRVLSFSEIPDITSMLKFWENGFSFKGMRYILSFGKNTQQDADTEKKINLYIGSDMEIKIFEIKADTCLLNIESMTSATDYNITVENAEVTTTGFKTTSNFNINSKSDAEPAKSVTLNMSTALLANLNINAEELNMNSGLFRCSGEAVITCDSGEIDIASVKKIENLKLDIQTDEGTILIDGSAVTSPFTRTTAESTDAKYTITSKSANIKIVSINSSASTDDSLSSDSEDDSE